MSQTTLKRKPSVAYRTQFGERRWVKIEFNSTKAAAAYYKRQHISNGGPFTSAELKLDYGRL